MVSKVFRSCVKISKSSHMKFKTTTKINAKMRAGIKKRICIDKFCKYVINFLLGFKNDI